MAWWDGGFVGWWLRCLTINTVLVRWLGGMMGYYVVGNEDRIYEGFESKFV
jgi:hypothetical protein